jgi:transposase
MDDTFDRVPAVARDARSLSREAQEELRREAIRLAGAGRSQVEVARRLGVSRQAVGKWVAAHRRGGDPALAAGQRGRRPGHTKLSNCQQRWLAGLISGHSPDQLSLEGSLWTRARVRELVRRELGLELGDDTVRRYLVAWRFSPQQPVRRLDGRSDEAVLQWLERGYPYIAKRAHCERAKILWAAESWLRSAQAFARTEASGGPEPITYGTGRRFEAHVIAAISNTGHVRFGVFDERFTRSAFVDFLDRLVREANGRKVLLIVDDHPGHRARVVRDWVAAHPDQIEMHFLPGLGPPPSGVGSPLPATAGDPEPTGAETVDAEIDTRYVFRGPLAKLRTNLRTFLRSSASRPTRGATSPGAAERQLFDAEDPHGKKLAANRRL